MPAPRRLAPLPSGPALPIAWFVALALHVSAAVSHAQAVRESTWVTDGTVYSLASTGATVFAGGSFSSVGPWTGGAGALTRATGQGIPPSLRVHGRVSAVVSDGSGGWYLGGVFTSLRGEARTNLAHVLADGSVAAWSPGADAEVKCLVVVQGRLIVGGAFTNVGGESRRALAAFDSGSGALLPWNPDVEGSVSAFASSGDTLWVGGVFSHVSGVPRAGLAAVSVASGVLLGPEPDGPVGSTSGGFTPRIEALACAPGTLYAGGQFGYFGPQTGSAASLDSVTGRPSSPRMRVVGNVRAVLSDGAGGWYLGGRFTEVAGVARTNLAHVLADGSVADWSPAPDDTVFALARTGNAVVAGGAFTNCAGQPRSRLAVFDATSGALTGFAPGFGGSVRALLAVDSLVMVGGSFSTLSGTPHRGLVAVNPEVGRLATAQPLRVNGTVHALARAGDRLFIGGEFAEVGEATGTFAEVTAGTGEVDATMPDVIGALNRVIPDGSGGWFLGGGGFTVGGQSRTGLARVLADGAVVPWAPVIVGSVVAMVRSGSTLYVAGTTSVDGQPRGGMAAFDLASGALLPWNPTVDPPAVSDLALLGDTLYLAGSFSTVGGQPRRALASVHSTSGALTSWAPALQPVATATVERLLPGDGVLYVGGTFSAIGANVQTGLAAVDPITAQPTSWNPSVGGSVRALARSGNTLYLGGWFTTVGSAPRSLLAAVDAVTGAVTPWNPGANGLVTSILPVDGAVIVGGGFIQIAGIARARVAALDPASGAALQWLTGADGIVSDIGVQGTRIALVGSFSTLGLASRTRLCSWNLATRTLESFAPTPNAEVLALAATSSRLVVGGAFTLVNGVTRRRMASFTPADVLEPLSLNFSDRVRALAVSGNKVYAGGDFLGLAAVGAQLDRLAVVDAVTRTVQPWNPAPQGSVHALSVDAGVFAAGDFLGIGGRARGSFANLSTVSGAVGGWAPQADRVVRALALTPSTVVAGGDFLMISNSARRGIAAIDRASGVLIPWVTDASLPGPSIRAVTIVSDTIVVGGAFTSIRGTSRLGLAMLSVVDGSLLGWNAGALGTVQALAAAGTDLMVGGDLASVGLTPRSNLAAFDAVSGEVRPWNPGALVNVTSLHRSGDRLYLGGALISVGGQPRNNAAVVDTLTGAVLPWDPNPDGIVNAFATDGATVHLGGSFVRVGGVVRPALAAVDATTGALLPWNAATQNSVNALLRSGDTLWVGGTFTTLGGQPRSRLGALSASTATALPWLSGADGSVMSLAMDGGHLVVGGSFVQLGGQVRQGLGAVDRESGALLGGLVGVGAVQVVRAANGVVFAGGTFWDPYPTGRNLVAYDVATGERRGDFAPVPDAMVWAIEVSRGSVFVGGSFQTIAGQKRPALASLADPSFGLQLVDAPPRGTAPGLWLSPSAPNPLRSAGTIRFSLPRAGRVRLVLYDVAGREACRLLDGEPRAAGVHALPLGRGALQPGAYWCRLDWEGRSVSGSLVVVP